MCLPACLWAHIARSPFNYTITVRTLLEKCDDYQFQRSILQFPTVGKNYRIASMLIMTRALGTPRLMSSEEKVAPCFVRQNISWSSNESSRKHENIALKSTMTKQWNSLHFTREFVCTTHLRSRLNILKCLTDSHMTMLSKSNYRVRLNANKNIADSISLHFNFGERLHFVLRVKQQIFNRARFFLNI